jgi:hypothetical protein
MGQNATKRRQLKERVATAATELLADRSYVAPLDVLVRIGWVTPNVPDAWRRGRHDDVETSAQVAPVRLRETLELLEGWALGSGLEPTEVDYVAATRDRRQLQFTADGDAGVERAYRTHFMSPDLPTAQRTRVEAKQNKAPDLVVIMPLSSFTCAGCGQDNGGFLTMDDVGPLCLTCTDMDHLDYLPSGDAALTRRAKKLSGLWAVVVRFSRSRKRYERQGVLVEEVALEEAERQCLADEDARMRRRERDRERRAEQDVVFQADLAKAIADLFPGCPPKRAEAIARHAGQRGSGRVGRSAAGRALDATAVTSAVVASVRHSDTRYDELLMSGVPREDARDMVRRKIDDVLSRWRPSE